MEIIGNFGIEPVYLIAQIVNFILIFYLLKRFAYKPILELLKKREESIKEGMKQAEQARILLEKAVEKEKDIFKTAQQEAKKLLDDARKQSTELIAKSDETARKQSDYLLSQGKEQIANEAKETERRLTLQISRLAISFLQKSLANLLSEKEQQLIMKTAIKKLKDKSN